MGSPLIAAPHSVSTGKGTTWTVGRARTSKDPSARKDLTRWKIAAWPARAAAICSPVSARPFSMFQARVGLTCSRWARSSGARLTSSAARRTWKTSSASDRSGAASATAQPACSSRSRIEPSTERTSGCTGRSPRSNVHATRTPRSDAGRRSRKSAGRSGRASGSPGSRPHIPASSSAASGALRERAPITERDSNASPGISPGVVRSPTRPQKAAGFLMLEARSEPSANGTIPVATAAAAPPLLPPGVSRVSNGLRVGPKTGLNVWAPAPNSGVFVFPTTTAPACLSSATCGASNDGTYEAKIGEPNVVLIPAVSARSLIAMGSPCSGPRNSPRAARESSSAAAEAACSGASVTIALTAGLTASILASTAASNSAADSSRDRISRARSTAGVVHRSIRPSHHEGMVRRVGRSVLAAVGGKDAHERGGGEVKVVGYGDPLRPRPPEPPDAILTATGVHVLLERPRPRVRHVQAGHAPRRLHQPGLKPPVRQLIGQLLQVNRLHLVRPLGPLRIAGPSGFHPHHRCYLSQSTENLTLSRLTGCLRGASRATDIGKVAAREIRGHNHSFPTHADAPGRGLVH